MKILEKILTAIAILAILLKFFNVPVSSQLLFVSLLILSLIYYFLGFALFNNVQLRQAFKSESYKGLKPIRIVASIGLGWGLSILTIGIMFDILRYPLSKIFLVVGLIIASIFFIFLIVLLRKRIISVGYGIIIRTLAISIIAIVLLILPSYTIEKIQYRNDPDLIELIKAADQDSDNDLLEEEK